MKKFDLGVYSIESALLNYEEALGRFESHNQNLETYNQKIAWLTTKLDEARERGKWRGPYHDPDAHRAYEELETMKRTGLSSALPYDVQDLKIALEKACLVQPEFDRELADHVIELQARHEQLVNRYNTLIKAPYSRPPNSLVGQPKPFMSIFGNLQQAGHNIVGKATPTYNSITNLGSSFCYSRKDLESYSDYRNYSSLFSSELIMSIKVAIIQDNTPALQYLWELYMPKSEKDDVTVITEHQLHFLAIEYGSLEALKFLCDHGAVVSQVAIFNLNDPEQSVLGNERTIKLSSLGLAIYSVNQGLNRELAKGMILFLLNQGEDHRAKVVEGWQERRGYYGELVQRERRTRLIEFDTTGLLRTCLEEGKKKLSSTRSHKGLQRQIAALQVENTKLKRRSKQQGRLSRVEEDVARGGPEPAAGVACRFFKPSMPASCRFGEDCHFSHDSQSSIIDSDSTKPTQKNEDGVRERPGPAQYSVACRFFKSDKPASCRYGEDCRFTHDAQTNVATSGARGSN